MSTKRTSVAVAVAVACGVLALPSLAGAAPSGVTIHHKGQFHFYGYVFSPKPHRCAKGRTVRLFKQSGKTQNRPFDTRVVGTRTFKTDRGRYKWSFKTKEPFFQHGRFYARVAATSGCQRDSSRTIHIG